jgi:1,4-alpha-glucan branching enzyme
VLFLQNHDQIGNRPFGDRLTTIVDPEALSAAIALQLLCPNIPLLFMGEEYMSGTPFQFFTDFHGALADAVREGRRREFSSFTAFSSRDIPDPNAIETFERSRPSPDSGGELHRQLLAMRHEIIIPRLVGTRAIDAVVLGPAAVLARWRMGDGAVLAIAINLGLEACPLSPPRGARVFETRQGVVDRGELRARSTAVFLEAAQP